MQDAFTSANPSAHGFDLALYGSRYQSQEAQAYYQALSQMQAQDNLARMRYVRESSYWGDLRDLFLQRQPAPGGMRYYAGHRQATAEGLGERPVRVGLEAAGFLGETVGFTGAAIVGSKAFGIPGMIAGSLAAAPVMAGINRYLGLGEMTNQFSRIDDLRMASSLFSARSRLSDPSGRLDRDESRAINDRLENWARFSSAFEETSQTSDELREEVAQFSEMKLLENVSSADDFSRKFSALKESLRKIVETLGTTHEEAVAFMGEMRRSGVSPFATAALLETAGRLGTMAGLDFGQVQASGIAAAHLYRGSGFGADTAYRIGAQAESTSAMIYQQGLLDRRRLHALGGEEGLKQSLQALPLMMTTGENAYLDLALLAAADDEGVVQGDRFRALAFSLDYDTLSREALRGGPGRLSKTLAKRTSNLDRLAQEDPYQFGALALLLAEKEMKLIMGESYLPSMDEVASFAADRTGGQVTKDQLLAVHAQYRALEASQGRDRISQQRLAEARLNERLHAMPILMQTEFYNDLFDAGSGSAQALRGGAYGAARALGDVFSERMTGRVRMSGVTSPQAASAARTMTSHFGNADESAPYYTGTIFNRSDASDFINEYLLPLGQSAGLIGEVVRKDRGALRTAGGLSLSAEEIKRLGLDASLGSGLSGGGAFFAEEVLRGQGVALVDSNKSDRIGFSLSDPFQLSEKRDEVLLLRHSELRAAEADLQRRGDRGGSALTLARNLEVDIELSDEDRRLRGEAARHFSRGFQGRARREMMADLKTGPERYNRLVERSLIEAERGRIEANGGAMNREAEKQFLESDRYENLYASFLRQHLSHAELKGMAERADEVPRLPGLGLEEARAVRKRLEDQIRGAMAPRGFFDNELTRHEALRLSLEKEGIQGDALESLLSMSKDLFGQGISREELAAYARGEKGGLFMKGARARNYRAGILTDEMIGRFSDQFLSVDMASAEAKDARKALADEKAREMIFRAAVLEKGLEMGAAGPLKGQEEKYRKDLDEVYRELEKRLGPTAITDGRALVSRVAGSLEEKDLKEATRLIDRFSRGSSLGLEQEGLDGETYTDSASLDRSQSKVMADLQQNQLRLANVLIELEERTRGSRGSVDIGGGRKIAIPPSVQQAADQLGVKF